VKSASTVAGGRGASYEASTRRAYDPHDHYNTTVGRGDMSTPPLLVVIVVVVSVLVFLRVTGWL
jgi:hypothetical protein